MSRKPHTIEIDKLAREIVFRSRSVSSSGRDSDKELNVATVWKKDTNTTETWFEVIDHDKETRFGDLLSAVKFYNTLP